MDLRETILAFNDLPLEKVHVKQWKMDVYVRGLSAAERDQFESEMFDVVGKDVKMNKKNLRARLVLLTICDDKGVRIFKDEDLAALGKKSGAALDRLFSVAQRLSGIGVSDVEEMVSNLEKGPQG